MLLHESAVYSTSIEEMLLVEPLIDARDRLPCIDGLFNVRHYCSVVAMFGTLSACVSQLSD